MKKLDKGSSDYQKPKVVVTFERDEFEKIKRAANEGTRTLSGQVRHMLKPILQESAA